MSVTTKPERRSWNAPHRSGRLHAAVSIPGSKSQTARALVLSALADAPSTIVNPLESRDSLLMVEGLRSLGAQIDTGDPTRWHVQPAPQPRLRADTSAEIDCGLSGTVLRFLPPVAALSSGDVHFDGDAYTYRRPNDGVLRGLQQLGVTVTGGEKGTLPFTVGGIGTVKGGEATIDASASSQFITALLLAAPRFEQGIDLRHDGPDVPSRPYLEMAVAMLRQGGVEVDNPEPNRWRVRPGPIRGREWVIEPDLQNAAPFILAPLAVGGQVTVRDWPIETTQSGDHVREIITRLGGRWEWSKGGLTVIAEPTKHNISMDLSDCSELVPCLAALAAVTKGQMEIRGVEHIRGHETDRLSALARELTRLGATVDEHRDGLTVFPGVPTASIFDTYDDHRMAHAGALAGLAVGGVELSDVACTSKTWPRFPQVWEEFVTSEEND
ncbi:3-phosphoshikimate 1-carboxyvinyltransferase [Haloglycomyces albus]|uniref:3-phosphoshikimate 1-carboxyvinyltransferase n=1 Tax=Haloglycomyces albus TaxID=526067 RepID=UPI0004A3F734|nr:3-phosphoshikimate 1-carboxyvinyltransferase [Haloglycomyces albus]